MIWFFALMVALFGALVLWVGPYRLPQTSVRISNAPAPVFSGGYPGLYRIAFGDVVYVGDTTVMWSLAPHMVKCSYEQNRWLERLWRQNELRGKYEAMR